MAIGSGFVVDGRHLVTNRHVVAGASRLQVETWDGRRVAVGDAHQAVDTDLGVIDLPARSARRLEPLALADEPTPLWATPWRARRSAPRASSSTDPAGVASKSPPGSCG